MMNRMECKLSQDVRVEARFGPDTTKEPVRIVPELSLKLRDLLVQEGTEVVEVVLTTIIQPKESKLISACAPGAKELFKRRILFIYFLLLFILPIRLRLDRPLVADANVETNILLASSTDKTRDGERLLELSNLK